VQLGELSTKNVFFVAPDDSVDQAFKLMEDHGVHHLPVLDSGQVVGMVSDRDLLVAGVGGSEGEPKKSPKRMNSLPCVAEIMSQPVLTLSPDDPLRSATWLMVKHRIHAIPLVRNERLVGLVSDSDLLRGVIASRSVFQFAEEDFFLRPVISHIHGQLTMVKPTASLYDVVDIMCRKKIRHLPVVVDGTLLGIVSDRDVRQALGRSTVMDARSQESGELYIGPSEVYEIMSPAVNTLHSSATTQEAVEELLRLRVHCLPVVDSGELLGVITDTDLLRAIGALDKQDSL
jgi:acetoin utilization protein AcuB